jgi:hypothetical protein
MNHTLFCAAEALNPAFDVSLAMFWKDSIRREGNSVDLFVGRRLVSQTAFIEFFRLLPFNVSSFGLIRDAYSRITPCG